MFVDSVILSSDIYEYIYRIILHICMNRTLVLCTLHKMSLNTRTMLAYILSICRRTQHAIKPATWRLRSPCRTYTKFTIHKCVQQAVTIHNLASNYIVYYYYYTPHRTTHKHCLQMLYMVWCVVLAPACCLAFKCIFYIYVLPT